MQRSFLNWLLLGGLSLAAVVLLMISNVQVTLRPEYLLLFSFPHFVLSYYLFFQKVELSPEKKFELLKILVPVLLLLMVFAIWRESRTLVIYFSQAVFFYHISLQAFGVTMLYSESSRNDKVWRASVKATVLFWGGYAWLEQQTSFSSLTLFKTDVASLNISPIVAAGALGAAVGMTIICVGVYFFRIFSTTRKASALFALTGVLSFVAWCIPALKIASSGLIAIFHGIQYLPFAVENLRSKSQSLWVIVVTLVLSFGVGALAFDQVPRFLSKSDPINSTFYISCLYLLLNLTHFFLERTVWKQFKA